MDIAITTFNNILKRQDNPKGIWSKAVPSSRNLINFSLPMILSNLVLLLKDVLPKEQVDETVAHCVDMVMNTFLDKERGIIFENVLPNGEHHDSYEGRLINPGHGIESMWFIMDIAKAYGNDELMKQAVDTTLSILEYGWDKEHEGILYFLDEKGNPPLQLEWDQKLWWVHLETLISLSKGYLYTGDERCWEWYKKVHEYSWLHFNDEVYGEWYGYLNRQGQPLTTLKGSKWKGCFHLPRALYQCSVTFDALAQKHSK
jgi:N-acylglucosamine 2-epimerase